MSRDAASIPARATGWPLIHPQSPASYCPQMWLVFRFMHHLTMLLGPDRMRSTHVRCASYDCTATQALRQRLTLTIVVKTRTPAPDCRHMLLSTAERS